MDQEQLQKKVDQLYGERGEYVKREPLSNIPGVIVRESDKWLIEKLAALELRLEAWEGFHEETPRETPSSPRYLVPLKQDARRKQGVKYAIKALEEAVQRLKDSAELMESFEVATRTDIAWLRDQHKIMSEWLERLKLAWKG